MSNGKGDIQRPRQISDREWEDNWTRTFRSGGIPLGPRPIPDSAERARRIGQLELPLKPAE